MSDEFKVYKPELNVTIDRKKQSLGISVIDIAQTLLSLKRSVLVIS
jgi:hypothetical protein